MTNEELVEEIYHEAFEKGFIDELNTNIYKLHNSHRRLNGYERVEKAYYTIKKNIQSPTNIVD
jgi:hypothetical protein